MGLEPGPGIVLDAPVEREVELAVALGGDGTILRALQHYAGTGVPVFGINFGEIGFLSTVEHDDLPGGVGRALSGEFELLRLPSIAVELPDGSSLHAMNDLAITRKAGDRVAELSYSLDSEEAGRVRCDGLVVATPAGSTGYNLANGGPVMAWGVEGLVVSFIAPHSMTARALVVAPGDQITIRNGSRQALDVALDGRPAGKLPPEATIGPTSSETSARSRSCRARPSTGVCARSSVGSRAERAQATRASPSVVRACSAGPSWLIEVMKLSSWAREKRRWPPGVR